MKHYHVYQGSRRRGIFASFARAHQIAGMLKGAKAQKCRCYRGEFSLLRELRGAKC